MKKEENVLNTKDKYKFFSVTQNGEIKEFSIPIALQDIFIEKLEKRKKLNSELRKLKFELKKSNYNKNNLLIRFHFKKSKLTHLKDDLSFLVDILSKKDVKEALLDRVIVDILYHND